MAGKERAPRPTIYVVTAGSYSDYGIQAMFSTKELAQAYIDAALAIENAQDEDSWCGNTYWVRDANIEEWPLDEEVGASGFTYWAVGMMADDGSVVEGPRKGTEYGRPQSRVEQCGNKVPAYSNRPIIRVRSVKSKDHALKLAAEARQKWLREGAEVPKSAQEWLDSHGLADLRIDWPEGKPAPQVDYPSYRPQPTLAELMESYTQYRERLRERRGR